MNSTNNVKGAVDRAKSVVGARRKKAEAAFAALLALPSTRQISRITGEHFGLTDAEILQLEARGAALLRGRANV